MPKRSPNTDPDFDYLFLTILEESVLISLYNQPLYGLQIVKAFDEASRGQWKISLGTLYPILERLEENGFIESEIIIDIVASKGVASRKYNSITSKGAFALTQKNYLRSRLRNWQPSYGHEPIDKLKSVA